MKYTYCILFVCVNTLMYSQTTTPFDLLVQNKPPLRKQLRSYPEARKANNTYRLKNIGGAVIGSSGVIILNHSLGSISPRKPHNWKISAIGVGLISGGLLLTKGAKKYREKAINILSEKSKVSVTLHSSGLSIQF